MNLKTNFSSFNRNNLSPKASIKSLVNASIVQDTLRRKRTISNGRALLILKIAVGLFPTLYCVTGVMKGCWTDISHGWTFEFMFRPLALQFRTKYRMEIYLREKSDDLYKIEKENIEMEKRGEKPTFTSPLVLWH